MSKLTDTQLIILSTAGQRDDGTVLPLPKSLKLQGGAVSHVLKSLVKKGLLDEQPAGNNAAAWRESKDGQRLTLVISDAGQQAIGVAADEQSEPPPASITPRGSKRSARRRKASESKGASAPSSKAKRTASPTALRPGTKLALLVDLLQRKGGTTIAEAMKATGWQRHSVRGAISGALKNKLGLAVKSEKVEGRGRVYWITSKR
jgi:Protein of unknown function (DUF3489)